MRSSLADWYDVPTGSMQPTIVEGDRIFVNKAAYYLEVPFTNIRVMQTGKVKRGDIVIIDSDHEDMRLVKRVVGLPGDCISMQNNVLTVNGETLTYRRQNPQTYEETLDNSRHLIQLRAVPAAKHSFSATCIPDKQLMVLGDNRNNSRDFRFIGFVSLSEIQGKATSVLFSLDPDDHYLPRPARTLRQLM
ncbi:signal peptidase I [Alteromonas halophila]|uniref:Signal peptidase I n=2 Tax=Alteromonas halophila TaxID=516698 RepID=A0A918JQX6_9ALTE|nr:signal peptidase I [Alteromonas halophila]